LITDHAMLSPHTAALHHPIASAGTTVTRLDGCGGHWHGFKSMKGYPHWLLDTDQPQSLWQSRHWLSHWQSDHSFNAFLRSLNRGWQQLVGSSAQTPTASKHWGQFFALQGLQSVAAHSLDECLQAPCGLGCRFGNNALGSNPSNSQPFGSQRLGGMQKLGIQTLGRVGYGVLLAATSSLTTIMTVVVIAVAHRHAFQGIRVPFGGDRQFRSGQDDWIPRPDPLAFITT
jgi:hypothetical protein